MKYVGCILISGLFAGCVANEPAPIDITIDMAAKEDSDVVAAQLEVIGEQLVEFREEATTVDLRLTRNYIVYRHDDTLIWFDLQEPPPQIEFFEWPALSFPGPAGEYSKDYAIGEERAYFVGEIGTNQTAIVGAEHEIGVAVPLFGQPVIILNVGSGNDFRGVSVNGVTAVAGMNEKNGVLAPHLAVISPTSNVEVIDTAQFISDRFAPTLSGPVFVTTDGLQKLSVNSRTVSTLLDFGEEVRADTDTLYLRNGAAISKIDITCDAGCDSTPLLEELDADDWHAANDTVVWFRDDVVGKNDEELGRGESNLLSILTDGSSIYWATKTGIYVYPPR